jgi:DNA polymerase
MISFLIQELEFEDLSNRRREIEDNLSLISLAKKWDECRACSLCENKKTPLFDTHYIPTQFCGVCFIGEGPGKVEKETGIPFSGPAGKILDAILGVLGLSRSEVYVTNVVKHRAENESGGDRQPHIDESKICSDMWLKKEIELLNPRVIVPLGGTALQAVRPDTSLTITQVAGQVLEGSIFGLNTIIVPLQHPAWVLHNPDAKPQLHQAVLRLKEILIDRKILEVINAS